MDRLSAIFGQFRPAARVFFSGVSCGKAEFDTSEGVGHIHIVKSGQMLATHSNGEQIRINQPSVLYYPQPQSHHFESCSAEGLELLCASIDLGNSVSKLFYDALPEYVLVPLSEINGLEPMLDVLFTEATESNCGLQVALDYLVAYFLILLLRYLIVSKDFNVGILAGLGDAKLSKALIAIHENPSHHWTLNRLAVIAGMSRAKFASQFRQVIGDTPMDYVTGWRIAIAQSLLKQGLSIKQVAPRVGYLSPAAMTRTFTRKLGVPPVKWMKNVKVPAHNRGGLSGLQSNRTKFQSV